MAHELLRGGKDTPCGNGGSTGVDERKQDADAVFLIADKPSKLLAMKDERKRCRAERWKRHKASLRAKTQQPLRAIERHSAAPRCATVASRRTRPMVPTLCARPSLRDARRRLLQG